MSWSGSGTEARGANALLFTGTYEHSIDAKQRLAIPSEVREALGSPLEGLKLYVVLCEGPTLCLYTQAGFTKRADELDGSTLPADEVLEYERFFFSLARPVELDKQGRVRLPDQLLKMVNLKRDVVLIGVKDHLEIHDRQAWYEHFNARLREKPQLLMNPRRAMGRVSGQGGGQ